MKPVDVARPSEITVDGALNDVAQGLNNFRKVGAATNTRYGLIVDEVTVTLKITASANDRSKLVVDVANVAPTVLQAETPPFMPSKAATVPGQGQYHRCQTPKCLYGAAQRGGAGGETNW